MTETELQELLERVAREGWKKLDLSERGLKVLPPEISQLKTLVWLDLSGNKLEVLPPEIGSLQRLKVLMLGKRVDREPYALGNSLSGLPAEFAQLQNLRYLSIEYNALTTLPSWFAKLEKLRFLSLQGNQLSDLPSEFDRLDNLFDLNLSKNRLKEFPGAIVRLVRLRKLQIWGNQLSQLPPEIVQLQNLTSLDLSSNQLSQLPPEIVQLQNLTSLDLGSNQLSQLPPEIVQLQNLTSLDLSSNQLSQLPPEIVQLQNLTSLDLGSNQLSQLPPEIVQLQNLTSLDLSSNQLSQLPPEIVQLQNLTSLNLFNNQLSQLPPEIVQLQNLTSLNLFNNQLSQLPPEIVQLQNLTSLNLFNNQLSQLPPEIVQLQNLTSLDLSSNQLSQLPPEIVQLQNLISLDLWNNQLSQLSPEIVQLQNLTSLDLSSNQLSQLPPEIVQLQNLTSLDLSSNQLSQLPPEIVQLQNLTSLDLSSNQLSQLPPEIVQLQNLTSLDLSSNQLSQLPPEIVQLQNLTSLNLFNNQLSQLPPEIVQLQNLTSLYLGSNQLSQLPPEIGRLTKLKNLYLQENQLQKLPPELAHLGRYEDLEEIALDGNPFNDFPPEIRAQNAPGIWNYLHELLPGSEKQWVSKMLVVGEGGVGKTSLIRALMNEEFQEQQDTTHGIEIRSLPMPHPQETDVTMRLIAWDFGGQEIYHATHQFFLTNRSLFVLVWNARLGFEQGKLVYWLKTIRANAPDSPVLLVASWSDERDADLPLTEIRERFPQVVGQWEISNKTGAGVEDLRRAIAQQAAALPLMGEVWPSSWLRAANAIRDLPEKHTTPERLFAEMAQHGVETSSFPILAKWLHELGDLLFFQENEELNETVVLKPQWVTESISRVLTDETVIEKNGIFTRDCMNRVWRDLEPWTRQHFLLLMERFDLSYRTLENRDISLVVERLPFEPPAEHAEMWAAITRQPDTKEIRMKFQLSEILPGIPTWFIARQHRFTVNQHWRTGVLFRYGEGDFSTGRLRQRQHLALVQTRRDDRTNVRYLQLAVRGPMPHHFFDLLKEGIELTLARYPGLQITRVIPCPDPNPNPDPDAEACLHEFDYANLIKRLERKPPKETIECPNCLEDISVTRLLFGLHYTTQDAVLQRMDDLESNIENKFREGFEELRELLQSQFARQFRREQRSIETQCPNVFVLRPDNRKFWNRDLSSQRLYLKLYCQKPGCWHPVQPENEGLYAIDGAREWLRAVAPYLKKMVKVMKYATPILGPWVQMPKEDYEKLFGEDMEIMKDLASNLDDDLPDAPDSEKLEGSPADPRARQVEGAALRSIRKLLLEKDPQQRWGDLRRTITPEGDYLWLCETHAREYKV